MNDAFDPSRHFNAKKAQAYDEGVAKVIPGYGLMHDLARLFLERELPSKANVLVVGAGTGAEIVGIGATNPGWRFVGVDPAADMLDVARRRVADAGLDGRVRLHHGRLDDIADDAAFDAATLILVMQFVAGVEAKAALLRAVARRLKPGAPLLLVDLHGEPKSPAFAKLADTWRSWQFFAGVEPSVVEDTFRNLVGDIDFVPKSAITRMLEDAGFATIHPFFRALAFGGWIAWRA